MWLYVPSVFAPESADWTSASESPSQALARSVTWRGKHSQPQHWSRRWRTVGWMRRLSGMTLEPLTASLGVGRWIASLRDCPASPTQSPELGRDTTTNGRSVPSSSELSKSVRPPWCFSKTSLHLFSTSDQSESDYQHWATGLRLEYSQRVKSAHRIGESDSLLWPTANAHDGRRPGSDDTSTQGMNLKRDAENWPTPSAMDSGLEGGHLNIDGYQTTLTGATRNWNTPTGRDWKDGSSISAREGRSLTNGLLSLQVLVTPIHGSESSQFGPTLRRRLNPAFVEWLMNLPIGWTAFEPVEMESWLSKQRGLLRRLLGE